MPYISATALIMYAPCFLRFPMCFQKTCSQHSLTGIHHSVTTCSSLVRAATSDARAGNSLRSRPRTCRATSVLHRRQRTDAHPELQPLLQRLLSRWRGQKQSTARSTQPRSQGTSGSSHSDKTQLPPTSEAEPSAQEFHARSIRSPRCNVEPPRIPARTELPPALANVLSPPFPLGSRASPAEARTIERRRPGPR